MSLQPTNQQYQTYVETTTGQYHLVTLDTDGVATSVIPLSGQVDTTTQAAVTINYPHKEIHNGDAFFVMYSVLDLGAMTGPDNTISFTFTTPNTTRWGHFQFLAHASADSRVRLIEAPSGGASPASPVENKVCLNNNRNSATAATLIALDGTVGSVTYDATLATGGTSLIDEYIEGATQGAFSSASRTGTRDEIILKKNTKYQFSVVGDNTDPATIIMKWYEHTNS